MEHERRLEQCHGCAELPVVSGARGDATEDADPLAPAPEVVA
jgi:hypothetical protein